MDIYNSEIVKDFLKRKSGRESTIKTYRVILNKYFRIIGVDDIDSYFKTGRHYLDDIWRFADAIRNDPPKSQVTYITCIKSFFERYEVEIKNHHWNDIKSRNSIKRVRPIRQKRTPNNADIKTILNFGDIKSRALFVFTCSAGMRIDEVLSLTFNDIDLENRHVRIRREIAKGGIPRDTFFSEEAKELVSTWLIERERYLLRSYNKSQFVREYFKRIGFQVSKDKGCWHIYLNGQECTKDELISAEKRLFPFNYTNAVKMWHNLLEKAGSPYNQKDGGYYLYNIHSLRRFWFTQLESAGANAYHINYMGGHESELNATYTNFEFKDLKKTYDGKMNALAIFSDMNTVEKVITPKLKEQETQLSVLSREYQKVSSDFEQFKKLVYYSIGVPPITDEQQGQRKDLEGFLPPISEEEIKVINAYRNLFDKKKTQKS